MRRRRYRSKGRDYSSREDQGLTQALRHIEEARQLSAELGGTDEDVKQYFFNLSSEDLSDVLNEYEKKYGMKKRSYAEETMLAWRSGRTKMSGLIAGRLYSLLPPRMPRSKKFDLVKSLWEKKGPRSSKNFFIGSDVSDAEVCLKVQSHFEEYVKAYTIPDTVVNRFKWLAADDVELQQELHNYFLQLSRQVVTEASNDRVTLILKQIRNDLNVQKEICQTMKIGNHSLELFFHQKASGITATRPYADSSADREPYWGCLVLIAFIVLAFLAYG